MASGCFIFVLIGLSVPNLIELHGPFLAPYLHMLNHSFGWMMDKGQRGKPHVCQASLDVIIGYQCLHHLNRSISANHWDSVCHKFAAKIRKKE